MKLLRLSFIILTALLLGGSFVYGQQIVKSFTEGLSVPLSGSYGREAVFTDELWYRYSVDSLIEPVEGDVFCQDDEGLDISWMKLSADDKGWFRHKNLRGGYIVFDFVSKNNQTLILEANGHSEVLVNGAPRGGDIYGYGWVQHPVKIRKGKNQLIFRVGRGKLQAKLVQPLSPVFLTKRDLLMPDLIQDDIKGRLGAVRIINATNKEIQGYKIKAVAGGFNESLLDVPTVPPFSSRKIPFELKWATQFGKEPVEVTLTLLDKNMRSVFSLENPDLKIQIKDSHSKHKETFVSQIDGSIQYYSVVPPVNGYQDSLALFFSLHGASVEAVNQANAYQAKDWGTIVAPTNRRPYGFDWEDWGRLDADEVLKLAIDRYHPDPSRMYLTGHSMGGHGAWQFGVTFPGYWAAIGPSAGWYSFWSYAGKNKNSSDDEISEIINRATLPSNTIGLSRNYLQYGIYVLHGDQDDNVPVSQARFMREHLGGFHSDFSYYERPGAGHWWGNECVDWKPMFDFFKSHRQQPANQITHFEFVSSSPGVSYSSRMLNILQQSTQLKLSSARYSHDVKQKVIKVEFENTARFMLDLTGFEKNQVYDLSLDSTDMKITPGDEVKKYFRLENNQWILDNLPFADEKGPLRNGLFKYAFKNKMVFVYGTKGNKEENEWAFNKARFDAETFWYRGNGAIEIIKDTEYSRDKYPERNVILFGHSEMNCAWMLVLDNCPIKVNRNEISIGEKVIKGEDLAAYFIYPLSDSKTSSVGVVAGTGLSGMKAASQNRYFVSGSGFPDFLIFKTEMLRLGVKGVVSAGFFDNKWQLDKAEYKIR